MNRESKAKHTAGPWRTELGEAFNVRAHHGGIVAQIHHLVGKHGLGGRLPHEESVANARLIAASPEMYEMLKSCLAFVDVLDLHGIVDNWSERPKLVELIKKIEG